MPITPSNPFKGRHFPGEVIVLCVRWYLRYPLSYQHVAELLAERGVEKLKTEGILPRRVRLRQCKYLNNVVEQDHRTVKKRTWLAKGYGSFPTAWRTSKESKR